MIPTIEEVEAAFSAWRVTKKSKGQRIPEELLVRARELTKEIPEKIVCKRLQLHKRKLSEKPTKEKPIDPFVEVRGIDLRGPSTAAVIVIEIREAKGKQITITAPMICDLKQLFSNLAKI